MKKISDIDLMQLTTSQASAVLQSIITDSSPSVVDVQTSYNSTQVQKVLTDQTANTNFGPNMVFNNVKEIHIHYHYNWPRAIECNELFPAPRGKYSGLLTIRH